MRSEPDGAARSYAAPSGFLRRALPYAAAMFFSLALYFPLLLMDAHIVGGDYADYNIPVRAYAAQAFHHGRIPFWATELFGGFPFLDDPQTAFFGPVNLIFAALFPHPESASIMDKFTLLQHLLIALGAVFLARSFGLGAAGAVVAGLAGSLNGHHLMHFGQINMIGSIGLGLFSLGCLTRAIRHSSARWAVTAGLGFSAMILTGHPQSALFTYYTAAAGCALFCAREAFWLRRPRQAWRVAWLAGLALGLGMAASLIQILPTRDLLAASQRAHLSLEDATPAEFVPREFPVLFFPGLYQPLWWRQTPHLRWVVCRDNWSSMVSFEHQFHIGFVIFALGLFGFLANFRRYIAHALFWPAILLLVCAMGKAGYLYPLIFNYFPGFRQMRIPPRLLWIAFMGWGILAGMALDAVIHRCSDPAVKAAARRSAATVALLWLAGAAVLGVYYLRFGSRVGAFQALFVTSPGFILGKTRSASAFVTDITQQLILATAAMGLCFAWLLLAGTGRARARRLLAACAVLAAFVELHVYGFHKNIVIGQPGPERIVDGMFTAVPEHIPGRLLSTDPGPWGKASGLVSGRNMAHGYGALVLEAVNRLLPRETVSVGSPDNERRMDLWNVTHLLFHNKTYDAALTSGAVSLPGTGWAELCPSPSPEQRSSLTWDLDTTAPVARIHLISAAGFSAHLPDGKPVAELSAIMGNDSPATTFPVRLGYETAEWAHSFARNACWPRHRQAPVAFINPIVDYYCPDGVFYAGSFDLPQARKLASVTVTARELHDNGVQHLEYVFGLPLCKGLERLRWSLPHGVAQAAFGPLYSDIVTTAPLYVSHLILEDTEGRFQICPAAEVSGRKLVASNNPGWLVLERRNGPKGYAWLVPSAEAETFKFDYKFVKERLLSESFDPGKSVILSKREIAPDLQRRLSAPQPASFSGHADFAQNTPEKFTVATDANQQGWLVMSHPYYKGWSAELDGKPVRLYRANAAFCAVNVPAGKHTVVMSYRKRRFAAGAGVSAAAWVLGLAFAALPRRNCVRT